MSYKPYPTYKDSGVEWLGEIPEGWELKRLKWSTTSVKNGVWGDEANGDDHDLACIRVADFDRRNQSVDESNLTFRNIAPSDLQGRLLEKGDLLIEKSGGGENWPVGYVVQFNHSFPAVTSNFIARVSLSTYANSSFFKYFHLSLYSARVTTRSINQTSGIQNLDSTSYFNNLAVFPPLFTQKAIAAFLDARTGQIDRLVQDYEELIALLKEKRQALVSHAVTRGLSELVSSNDPDFGEWALPVAFKDSGVEWLGEIPVGWEARRVKSVFSLIVDPAPDNNNEELLSIYTAIGVRPRKQLEEKGNRATTTDGYWRVKKGDFIVNKLLAWMGAIGISEFDGVTSPAYDILRPKIAIAGFFYHELFRMELFAQEMRKYSRGIMDMRLRLYFEEFGAIYIPYPQIQEQKAIEAYIIRETAKLDALVAEAEGAIELLKERRSALITAAVTGKINVEEMEVV